MSTDVVSDLLDELKRQPTTPTIYQVMVIAADHYSGFTVAVEFRTGNPNLLRSMTFHGETVTAALGNALSGVRALLCPQCGQMLPKAPA